MRETARLAIHRKALNWSMAEFYPKLILNNGAETKVNISQNHEQSLLSAAVLEQIGLRQKKL